MKQMQRRDVLLGENFGMNVRYVAGGVANPKSEACPYRGCLIYLGHLMRGTAAAEDAPATRVDARGLTQNG